MHKQEWAIDIEYDMRTDANGKDPDLTSITLKRYHQILWGKLLPNGDKLELQETSHTRYLMGMTSTKSIPLSSDTICNTYSKRKRMQGIIQPHASKIQSFKRLTYTIGGFIVFPGKKSMGKNTINQERGWIKTIDDRFDLTLECIRLYFLGKSSPLSSVCERYEEFFRLFCDFRGYTEFFLLQDLVDVDDLAIKFFLPFNSQWERPGLPKSSNEYLEFMQNVEGFLRLRNQRIVNVLSQKSEQ